MSGHGVGGWARGGAAAAAVLAMAHNFRFAPDGGPAPIESEISLLAPGQEVTIEFEVSERGDYRFECTFHLQLNQIGTMTVRG